MIRLIFWVLVATWLGHKLVGWLFGPRADAVAQVQPSGSAQPLYRDPCCGTHVSAEISHALEHAGQTLHFCSAECRERFRLSSESSANPDSIGASA